MPIFHRFLIIGLLSMPFLADAQMYTPDNVPDPKSFGTGYVSDPGGLLSAEDLAWINGDIAAMENSSTAQMAVVILPSIGEAVPREFAYELFNKWGVGQAGNNGGLLLLIVMDQRRSEIETGYGLEGLLPDVVCYRILMDELVPQFQAGQYGEGIKRCVGRVKLVLESPEAREELMSDATGTRSFYGTRVPNGLLIYALVALLFSLAVITWVAISLYGKDDLYDKYGHVRKVTGWWWIILFPVPYVLIYLVLKRLLAYLRKKPRHSPSSGQLLHLLTEQEEDTYLNKGQITEEMVKSIDYDVWVSDDGEEVLVLPYARWFSKYKPCKSCGFKTYCLEDSVTVVHATRSSTGLRRNRYQCKNCHYQHEETVIIPKVSSSSGSGGGSGGGSWGGGSSGGGGAGASW